jgi:hypothetical protein
MRSIVWFFTRTRMSRGISDSPMGAAWAKAGSMWRCHRSGGSITWRSLSAITWSRSDEDVPSELDTPGT